jgi:tetratricopeptide (TPR) repeat protein
VEDKIKEIMRLAMLERWDEARIGIRQLIEADPNDPGIKVLQADIENLSGNEKEALRQLKGILGDCPEFAPAYYSAGIVHARQGRWDQAKTFFEKSIFLLASDQKEMLSDAWLQLGIAHWEQRQPEDAMESWKKSLSFNPAQWKARGYLEEFTPDYSKPKTFGEPEFFMEFQELQVQAYLAGKGRSEFDSLDEADFLFRKITVAWKEIPEKWNIEEMADIERIRYFKSVRLV